MNIPWPKDPKTSQQSVSLGILVVATLCMVVAVGISLSGITRDVSIVTEFWLGAAGLYFGRKYSSKSGSVMEALTEVEKSLASDPGAQK